MQSSVSRKAVMIAEDFQHLSLVSKNRCIVLQHYEYKSTRPLNSSANVYNSTTGTVLSFEMVIDDYNKLKVLYDRINDTSKSSFSFIFNPEFAKDLTLTSYDMATVVDGFVVEIAEHHDNYSVANRQMSATIRILVSRMLHIAKDITVEEVIS